MKQNNNPKQTKTFSQELEEKAPGSLELLVAFSLIKCDKTVTVKINGEDCLPIHGFGDIGYGTCIYLNKKTKKYLVLEDETDRDNCKPETFDDPKEAFKYALDNADYKPSD